MQRAIDVVRRMRRHVTPTHIVHVCAITAAATAFAASIIVQHWKHERSGVAFDARVQCYARQMNLTQEERWLLYIDYLPPDSSRDYYAATEVQGRVALVSFDTAAMFADLSPRMQRAVIVHEFMHVWVWQLALLAEEGVRADEGLRVEEAFAEDVALWRVWNTTC